MSESQEISRLEVRELRCLVCDAPYEVRRKDFSGRDPLYCSYECKEKAKTIRRRMTRNGQNPDNVAEFLKWRSPDGKAATLAPHEYTPITQAERIADREARRKLELEKQKERTNAQRLRTQAEKARLAALKDEKEATKALQKAAKEAGLMPLSEAKDILSGKSTFLPEQDISRARAAINHIVTQQLMLVDKVMSGEVTWSSTQANLFRMLLNKVVPDAASQKVKDPGNKRGVEDMTVEELEELVASHTDKSKVISQQ